MKKLWMRAGISLMLADEEIDEILGGCEGAAGEEAVVAALREGRFTFDGDSYIPQSTVEEFTKEHGLPYAAKEPEFCLHPLGGFRLTGEEANQGNDREGIRCVLLPQPVRRKYLSPDLRIVRRNNPRPPETSPHEKDCPG